MTVQHEPPSARPLLTPDERDLLGKCEAEIHEKLESITIALATINTRRLYRETHSTFEAYVRSQFKIGRSRAYQLIDAAAIVANLSTTGGQSKNHSFTERQLRPLARLTPDQQVLAMQEAVAAAPDGKPSASQIKTAAEKHERRRRLAACEAIIRPRLEVFRQTMHSMFEYRRLGGLVDEKLRPAFELIDDLFPPEEKEKAASATTQAA